MKKILLFFILIMAIGMAGTVAYVSVTGLLKVFAGAGTVGLILFSSIEAAKIVATTAIHTYGKKIGWFYNLILSFFIIIAMAITSMGIYGFLSSSYKESFAKMETVDAKVELLEKKRDGYQQQLDVVTNEKESLTVTITELTKGLANNVIQYKDPETGEIITTTSSTTRKVLEGQLNDAIVRQDTLNSKSDVLSEEIFELDNQITEVKLSDDSAAELGPLKYLADVTGMTMDEVMKYFILLLIIIGDPMAVIMVIVFSKVVNYGKDGDAVSEVVNDAVSEVVNDGPSDEIPIPEDYILTTREEEPMDNDIDVEVEHEDIEVEEEEQVFVAPVVEEKEEVKEELPEFKVREEKKSDKVITEKDIEEIKAKDRGFSVTVPSRKGKSNNTIGRIGTNKEVRGNNGDIIFKRRT